MNSNVEDWWSQYREAISWRVDEIGEHCIWVDKMNTDSTKWLVKGINWIMELETAEWTKYSWEETRDVKWGQRINDQ